MAAVGSVLCAPLVPAVDAHDGCIRTAVDMHDGGIRRLFSLGHLRGMQFTCVPREHGNQWDTPCTIGVDSEVMHLLCALVVSDLLCNTSLTKHAGTICARLPLSQQRLSSVTCCHCHISFPHAWICKGGFASAVSHLGELLPMTF